MSHRLSFGLLLFSLLCIDGANAQHTAREARWSLSVQDARVTATIDAIPLRLVLEELGRQVSLQLSLGDGWRDYPVTARLHALPLDEALAQLLMGLPYGLIIEHRTGSAATKPVVEVIVSGKSGDVMTAGAQSASAVSIHTPAQQPDAIPPQWMAALQHTDSAIRLQALERWAEQDTATVLNPLMQALVDTDESVRSRAQALVESIWAAKPEQR
jgi:hypothetical protein